MIITVNVFTGKIYFYQRLLFVLKPRWNLFTQLPFLSSNQDLNHPPTPCGLNSSYFCCYQLSLAMEIWRRACNKSGRGRRNKSAVTDALEIPPWQQDLFPLASVVCCFCLLSFYVNVVSLRQVTHRLKFHPLPLLRNDHHKFDANHHQQQQHQNRENNCPVHYFLRQVCLPSGAPLWLLLVNLNKLVWTHMN